jgi:hypothetical protein
MLGLMGSAGPVAPSRVNPHIDIVRLVLGDPHQESLKEERTVSEIIIY